MIRIRVPAALMHGLGARGRSASFFRDRIGTSTIEFAMVVPVVMLILAGIVDIGRLLNTKFNLDTSMATAVNYTLVNAEMVNPSDGATLLGRLANILIDGGGMPVRVSINDGLALDVTSNASNTSGSAASADLCYCPTQAGASISWGPSKACGAACADGSVAGKFVVMSASAPFAPLFTGFGIIEDDAITVRAVVKPQ
jgi:Flp pilus assembly protein TadG